MLKSPLLFLLSSPCSWLGVAVAEGVCCRWLEGFPRPLLPDRQPQRMVGYWVSRFADAGEQRRLSLVWASLNVGGFSEFGVVVAVVVCVWSG